MAPILLALFALCAGADDTLRVATFNVENYLDHPTPTRPAKSGQARAAVRRSILALKPDVIALEEIGAPAAFEELRGSLKTDGADFPFWDYVHGSDTNIHIAILSRIPIVATRPHTNESFLLNGRRHFVSRGFAEVDIQVRSNLSFTLIAAHLKSKRQVPWGDESDLRFEEARLLRTAIDTRFASDPAGRFIVLGDLNDSKDSKPVREILGRRRNRLFDTRPSERMEGAEPAASSDVTWTDYYSKEDSYARIDYILLGPGMLNSWVKEQTYVLSRPDWALASDHRPLIATFDFKNE